MAAFVVSARNAYDSHGHTRLFWGLMTAGMAMWSYNQACWTWFEVVLRKPLPEPSPGAMVLFLHIVPIIAAVAIRPHQVDEREGMLPSTLNVLILLVWWIVVYAFLVFPEEYIVPDVAAYMMRRDLLYRVDEGILIAASATAFFTSSGSWRKLYRNIFLATVIYTLSLEVANAAVVRGLYQTGKIYDLPFLAAVLGFPLGHDCRTAISSRNAGHSLRYFSQPAGRTVPRETRSILSAPHGLLGALPQP